MLRLVVASTVRYTCRQYSHIHLSQSTLRSRFYDRTCEISHYYSIGNLWCLISERKFFSLNKDAKHLFKIHILMTLIFTVWLRFMVGNVSIFESIHCWNCWLLAETSPNEESQRCVFFLFRRLKYSIDQIIWLWID